MSSINDRPTARREFLGKLAASAVVLSGAAACASPAGASPGATAPVPAPTAPVPAPTGGRASATGAAPAAQASIWDDSWFEKLTAKHKAVFDSPGIDDGNVASHVSGYIKAMKDALGAEAQAVIVIRHMAIPMAFNNTIWSTYAVGKAAEIKRGADYATQNPYANMLKRLTDTGVIILACNLATQNYAGKLAAGSDRNTVYAALKENLIPGCILQPTGVYAFHRAQEAGCTSIRSTI